MEEVWEGFLTDYWDASVSMACEKAKRSWCVRIVTSVTGRLPPTPSMQSLHKLRSVFPPHMASIGAYCCCCVCSTEKKKKTPNKTKTARHSSTDLIMKSLTGKQLPVSQSRGYFCGDHLTGRRKNRHVIFPLLFIIINTSGKVLVYLCLCFHACVWVYLYVCVWTSLYLKSCSSANKASCLLLGRS